MKDDKKVSVIMGVYNSNENKLRQAVDSILNQTYKNIELIICNDASTNNIADFLETLIDERVCVIRNNKNEGLAYSLNACLNVACGDYIARMDDDDISESTRLEKQVKFLDNNPEIDIVGTALWLIDDDGIWGEDYPKEYPEKEDLLYGVVHAHPTIMVRSEAYKKVGGYRVSRNTERTEDYDLYMRLYASGTKGYNLQEKLFYYTQTKDTFGKRRFKHRIDEMICRYYGFNELNLMPKGMFYVFKPIISGIVPNFIKQKILMSKLKCKK